jgi:hypothetical protein
MTSRLNSEVLIRSDEIVEAPAARACDDQSFELPSGVYVAMAALFAGFIGVLSLALRGGQMAIVYGVIFAFIAAFFAVPAILPAMAPSGKKALSWADFRSRGIQTATGRSSAGEATVLVLLLPALIFCFGIAIAVISAMID